MWPVLQSCFNCHIVLTFLHKWQFYSFSWNKDRMKKWAKKAEYLEILAVKLTHKFIWVINLKNQWNSKEVNKTIFSKFFFPDHFSVVSGGNKWSKNWRKSCCKQMKVTKVTYCVQSQQCPFWTLLDIFAPQILQICMLFRRGNYWICENNNKAKSRKIAHLVWPRKRSLPGT